MFVAWARNRTAQCHVDIGTVEVEAVAGRDHEPHHRLRSAERLHLADHIGQDRLRGRRAEHDQQLVLDVDDEAQDREAREARDGTEHDHHEQHAREIEGCDEFPEVDEALQAEGPDGERHGAEGADRREIDDDPDDAEEHLSGRIDGVRNALARRTQARDRDAAQDGDEQNLQQVAFGEGIEEARRDDAEEMRRHAVAFGGRDEVRHRLRIELRRIDVEACTRVKQFGDDQAELRAPEVDTTSK